MDKERSDRSSHCLCEHEELIKASVTEGNIQYFTKFLSFKYVLTDMHVQLQWSLKGETSCGFGVQTM